MKLLKNKKLLSSCVNRDSFEKWEHDGVLLNIPHETDDWLSAFNVRRTWPVRRIVKVN